VLNGHLAKLLLSGQADPASLELASKLVGDEAVLQTSETTGGDGRASLTESTAYRRLLPPEALRQLKPRRALLVYGHLPPVRIRLRPWFHSRRLVSLAMAVDAAVPHPAMQVDDLAFVEPLRRAGEDGGWRPRWAPSPTQSTLRAPAPGRPAQTDDRTLPGPILRVRPVNECRRWIG
jgi:type IV secretory pathway TraG/TraD family ATPase VirD4